MTPTSANSYYCTASYCLNFDFDRIFCLGECSEKIYTGECIRWRPLLRLIDVCLIASSESHEIRSTIDYGTKGLLIAMLSIWGSKPLFTVSISVYWGSRLHYKTTLNICSFLTRGGEDGNIFDIIFRCWNTRTAVGWNLYSAPSDGMNV